MKKKDFSHRLGGYELQDLEIYFRNPDEISKFTAFGLGQVSFLLTDTEDGTQVTETAIVGSLTKVGDKWILPKRNFIGMTTSPQQKDKFLLKIVMIGQIEGNGYANFVCDSRGESFEHSGVHINNYYGNNCGADTGNKASFNLDRSNIYQGHRSVIVTFEIVPQWGGRLPSVSRDLQFLNKIVLPLTADIT